MVIKTTFCKFLRLMLLFAIMPPVHIRGQNENSIDSVNIFSQSVGGYNETNNTHRVTSNILLPESTSQEVLKDEFILPESTSQEVLKEGLLASDLYVFVVGIERVVYRDSSELIYANKAAKDVEQFFLRQKGVMYNDVITASLTGTPSRQEILDGLSLFYRKITDPNAIFVLYIGSHGYTDTLDTNKFWLMPSDYSDQAIDYHHRNGISSEELLNVIHNPDYPNIKKVLLLDVCQSEGFMFNVAKKAIQKMEVSIIAACGKTENAIENGMVENSIFVHALLEIEKQSRIESGTILNMQNFFYSLQYLTKGFSNKLQNPKLVNNIFHDTEPFIICR